MLPDIQYKQIQTHKTKIIYTFFRSIIKKTFLTKIIKR